MAPRTRNNYIYFFILATTLGLAALMQNPYGQFSDIRGFYGMHFSDGMNHWPFSYHQLLGADEPIHPVEYPALTGLIMWLLSFFVGTSDNAWQHYYWITAVLNSLMFGLSAQLLLRIIAKRFVYFYLFSLAALYSLHRNWDIWAVVAMLVAVLYFERGNFHKSAFFLALATATKFFPIVLLLPIAISFYRRSEYRKLVKYVLETSALWVFINLPFMAINFEGWAYFYKFSYERGFGGGSIPEMFGKLGFEFQISKTLFYLLNCAIFGLVVYVLFKVKKPQSIVPGSFFVLFAFTFFNKQYSMQYIIWLTPFALMSISELSKLKQKAVLRLFLLWQTLDFAFQFTFFQNILTNTGIERQQIYTNTPISNFEYGIVSLVRYVTFAMFTLYLMGAHLKERKNETSINKQRVAPNVAKRKRK